MDVRWRNFRGMVLVEGVVALEDTLDVQARRGTLGGIM